LVGFHQGQKVFFFGYLLLSIAKEYGKLKEKKSDKKELLTKMETNQRTLEAKIDTLWTW
jgi:hypothetical protein